ncbi:Signal-transduction histidine kinase senX3 [Pseudoclavibacter triregionum]|nr:Signal-transduction histidine kinase senX3 [Pseudoclavibacter triregionum]
MESSVAIVAAIALGFVLGGGFAWLLVISARRRERMRALTHPQLPDGFEHLLDALDTLVIVADPSHNVIQASPGVASKGLVKVGNRLIEPIGRLGDRARREGGAVTEDLEVPRGPYGSASLHFRVRAAPLGVRFILILAEDRSEALRVESVRRDFVANVSHELKTPIGAVLLLSEALGEAADDPEQVRFFADRLQIEGQRLSRLTREIIDLSRLQSTDTMTDAEPVHIQDVLALAADQSRVAAEAKGIRLVIGPDCGADVVGNHELLLQCFHNLVANAVQYSPSNSRVGVGARIVGDTVEVAVSDQGIGISQHDQSRIFERFFRVDQARSRNTGGTGLGLSIVRHVVENHGGDIRVWSRMGKGSTFTVRIPLASEAISAGGRPLAQGAHAGGDHLEQR